jgi:hypothetical protein
VPEHAWDCGEVGQQSPAAAVRGVAPTPATSVYDGPRDCIIATKRAVWLSTSVPKLSAFDQMTAFNALPLLRTLPLGLLVLALGACGGADRTCEDSDEPYLAAANNPPLRVPDGLTAPDRSAALEVPAAPATSNRSGSGCLAEPPSYFRSSGMVARSPEEVVASWAQAWANREGEGVVSLYSSTFVAPTDAAGSAAWLDQRREQVTVGPVPDSRVENLRVESDGADRRVAKFTQRFGSNIINKELVLVREAGSWRIAQEKVIEVQ